MQSDDDNGMDGRPKYEHRASIETGITTIEATMQLPLAILPPEVFYSTENVSLETDVWSFGILLWEMFTGGQSVNRHMRQLHAQSPGDSPFSGEKTKLNQSIICYGQNFLFFSKNSYITGSPTEIGFLYLGQNLDPLNHLIAMRCQR